MTLATNPSASLLNIRGMKTAQAYLDADMRLQSKHGKESNETGRIYESPNSRDTSNHTFSLLIYTPCVSTMSRFHNIWHRTHPSLPACLHQPCKQSTSTTRLLTPRLLRHASLPFILHALTARNSTDGTLHSSQNPRFGGRTGAVLVFGLAHFLHGFGFGLFAGLVA
jgi:hypothetical protein